MGKRKKCAISRREILRHDARQSPLSWGTPPARRVPSGMTLDGYGETQAVDRVLARRLEELIELGEEIWARFDREVRLDHWHPFVPADYRSVLRSLINLRAPRLKFLEWGSATGVITIMADLLGFVACGIELDADLARIARTLALRFDSRARFAVGSFVPAGFRTKRPNGEGRSGTIGDGPSAYMELGQAPDEFDIVYAYPWKGEETLMLDVVAQYGAPKSLLLLNGEGGITTYRGGRILSTQP
jgi:hypothetical protein